MPKGKKKGKYEHRRTEQAYSSDEDAGIDMTIDNCSETSGQSDLKSINDDAGRNGRLQWGRKNGENRLTRTESVDIGHQRQAIKWKQGETQWGGPRFVKIEEDVVYKQPANNFEEENVPEEPDKKNEIQEKFEEKVLELIESLNARANAARAGAFVSLRAALQRRALDGLLSSHRATLADHVSKALRRGKDGERKAAAAIAPLLALQIGEEGVEEFVREVRPALAATAIDKSASLDTRTECCSSLAVFCYLMEDDLSEILEVMRMYETIFSGSYLKGDGSVKVSGAAVEEGLWHAAALDGWALLLPLLAPTHALQLLTTQAPSFAKLGELLEAVSLEVRMAAGGALAIAYETVTDEDDSDSPLSAEVDELLPRLTELARDSHKYRAKRDRKIQRATFRDILKYFEEGEVTAMSVRVGSETARWESWGGGAAYAALAAALGGALQALAPRCSRLRAALALAPAPLAAAPARKPNKLQRHLQNTAACKARTVARNKNRDKRSAALAI
ncbi:interferon-related developmental regulator 2 isoform X1 [Helicoverpa zea]|uniref:interferon-related developmental regulator 2 isoform X1 n=1 Tax=Helicoverpa zea TaxID=7113 RepID=UPI001F57FB80|nr:interferon-related developmental regulator 2 isoform X1 [Helicoverpa zea]